MVLFEYNIRPSTGSFTFTFVHAIPSVDVAWQISGPWGVRLGSKPVRTCGSFHFLLSRKDRLLRELSSQMQERRTRSRLSRRVVSSEEQAKNAGASRKRRGTFIRIGMGRVLNDCEHRGDGCKLGARSQKVSSQWWNLEDGGYFSKNSKSK